MRIVDFPLCIGKFFICLGFCFGDFVERVLTNLLCSRLLALFFDPFYLGGEVVEKLFAPVLFLAFTYMAVNTSAVTASGVTKNE